MFLAYNSNEVDKRDLSTIKGWGAIMNFKISKHQVKMIVDDLLISDIKEFIKTHPLEYKKFLEEQALLTNEAKNKLNKKGA